MQTAEPVTTRLSSIATAGVCVLAAQGPWRSPLAAPGYMHGVAGVDLVDLMEREFTVAAATGERAWSSSRSERSDGDRYSHFGFATSGD